MAVYIGQQPRQPGTTLVTNLDASSNIQSNVITATTVVGANYNYANGQPVVTRPSGSNGQIQYNANGFFGGSANLTFTDAAGLTVRRGLAFGNVFAGLVAANNIVSTANVDANQVNANLVATPVLQVGNIQYGNGDPYVIPTGAGGPNLSIQYNVGNALTGTANFFYNTALDQASANNFYANIGNFGLLSLKTNIISAAPNTDIAVFTYDNLSNIYINTPRAFVDLIGNTVSLGQNVRLRGNVTFDAGATLSLTTISANSAVFSGNVQAGNVITNRDIYYANGLAFRPATGAANSLQYNMGGQLGGISSVTYNSLTDTLNANNIQAVTLIQAANILSTGPVAGLNVTAGINVTAGSNVNAGNLNIIYGLFGNTARFTGNITGNIAQFSGNVQAGNLQATGNVQGSFILGNITQATGYYSNANVAVYLASNANLTINAGVANITTQGNVTGGYVFGNGAFLTGLAAAYSNANVVDFLASNANLTINAGVANITTQGNISAATFLGNGRFLTGIQGNYSNANVANYLLTNTANIQAGNIQALANISAGNANITGLVNTTTANAVTVNATNINSTGNINGANLTATQANLGPTTTSSLITNGTANIIGNVTIGGNLQVVGNVTTLNYESANISNLNIILAANATNASQANGAGFIIAGAQASFLYNSVSNTLNASHTLVAPTVSATTANVSQATIQTLTANTVTANISLSTPDITSTTANLAITSSGNININSPRTVVGNTLTVLGQLQANLDAANITTGILNIARGGTGLGNAPANGQILIGTGNSYNLTTLTAGSNLTITNTSGNITISANTQTTLAAGGNGSVQFNNGANAFANSAGLVFEAANSRLAVGGNVTAGNVNIRGNIYWPDGNRYAPGPIGADNGAVIIAYEGNLTSDTTFNYDPAINLLSANSINVSTGFSLYQDPGMGLPDNWLTLTMNNRGLLSFSYPNLWVQGYSNATMRIGAGDGPNGRIIFESPAVFSNGTITTGNVINTGNVTANGFYYSNGVAVGQVSTSGPNNSIQFANGAQLASSANLLYNPTTYRFDTTGNVNVSTVNPVGPSPNTWTTQSGFTAAITGIATNGTLRVAVGADFLATTTDGIGWTQANTQALGSPTFTGISFGSGTFVAATSNGAVYSSTDGTTWTQTDVTTDSLLSAAFVTSTFVTVGGPNVWTSTNGTSWTRSYTDPTQQFGPIATANSRYVMISNVGTVLTSQNGSTWSTSPAIGNLVAVGGNATTIVATAANGAVYTSTNSGTTFTRTATLSTAGRAISYDTLGQRWYIGSTNRTIYTSTDTVTWTTATTGATGNINALLTSGNVFDAVGDLGLLLTSGYPYNTQGYVLANGIYTDNYYYANGAIYQPAALPGGSNNNIQFNSMGALSGAGNLNWYNANSSLSVTGNVQAEGVTSNTITANTGTFVNAQASGNVTADKLYGSIAADGAANGQILIANSASNRFAFGNLVAGNGITISSNIAESNITISANVTALTAPGSNTNIIYNNNNQFAGSNAFSFDSNTNLVTITSNASIGNVLTDSLLHANGQAWVFGGVPGGATFNLQYNANGSFGGTNAFVIDTTANSLTIAGNINGANINASANLQANGGLTVGGNTVLLGNLQVFGTTTTVNANTLSINDLFITVANGALNPSQANGAGFKVGGANANFLYDFLTNSFISSHTISAPSLSANRDITAGGNLTVAGNINAQGGNGQIQYNLQGNLYADPGLRYDSANNSLYVQSNAYATYFIGNGAFLTGLAATYGNANVANYLAANANITISINNGNISTANGNVTANYFLGNGAFLTGLPATYSNANVVDYLASNSNITISIGNGNIATANGNVSANYFLGNGYFLTGLAATYGNANVVDYLASNSNIVISIGNGNISTANGNIQANYFLGNGALLTGIAANYGNANVADFLASNANLTITVGNGNIETANGNITANYYLGNGYFLTGLGATYSNANVANYLPTYSGNLANLGGNVTTSANITANYYFGNIELATGYYSNSNVINLLGSNSNIDLTIGLGNLTTQGTITSGNVTAANITTAGSLSANVTSLGNTTVTQINVSGNSQFFGNVLITGNLRATGNTTFINTDSLQVSNLQVIVAANATQASDANSAGIFANGANSGVTYTFSTNTWGTTTGFTSLGNLTGGNVIAVNAVYGNSANIAGNIYVSNILSYNNGTNVSVLSNLIVSGNSNVTGNLNALSNVLVTGYSNVTGNINALANLNVTANARFSSNTITSGYSNVAGNVNALANLNVTANAVFSSNTLVAGYSNVTGNINASSNLIVTNNAYFNANTFTTGNANISANVHALSNLIVTNNAYFRSNTFTTGNANISANVNALGNLIVTNNAYFSSNTFTTGNSNVTGNITGNFITANARVDRSLSTVVVFGSNATVDVWSSNDYVLAEYNYYWLQIANSSNVQSGKIMVTTANSQAYVTFYGVGGTNTNELVLFTAQQVANTIVLTANVVNNNSNVSLRVSKSYLTV